MRIEKPVLVLVGPTAVGKTSLSLQIAERYGAEIVSVDSMQIYRYMDIGTAKPTLEERGGIPHHLIDIVTPETPYDAAAFARDGAQAIAAIHERGRLPLLAGGTGLYLRALLEGLFEAPPIPEEVRQRLRERLEKNGVSALYQELAQVDPQSAERIARTDRQRMVRALEVYDATGISWSRHLELHKEKGAGLRFANVLHIGLTCERRQLYRRIDERCAAMIEAGLEEEVRSLLARGYHRQLKPMGAIGYRHMLDYLDGLCDEQTMLDLMRRDTRHYAKRQYTWFTRDEKVEWCAVDGTKNILARIDRWQKEYLGTP
jgi:tRNA dimethylallyltransferase